MGLFSDSPILATLGVSKGVLYPTNGDGIPWNGLQTVKTVQETATSIVYLDGVLVRRKLTTPPFSVVIESLTEVAQMSSNEVYGLTYRTEVEGTVSSYRIHMVYDLSFSPVDLDSQTSGSSTQPSVLVWSGTARPKPFPGTAPTAHLIVESGTARSSFVIELEDILYGSDDVVSHLPTFEEFLALIEKHAVLIITDMGDGTFTAEGPDDVVGLSDPTIFWIDWPSAVPLSQDTYEVSSL